MLALADVFAAQNVIRGVADGTPLVPSDLSQKLGGDLWLKLEICQPMGAFKLRGAVNAMAHLPTDARGVTCCSTGNHGRAVAYAAAQNGLRAVICMSELVPKTKVDGIRRLGAEVHIDGRSQDEAQAHATRLARADGLIDIPPFDDPHVIAGQGTIALEMLRARPDLDTLMIPLSGGGLAAGMAVAARAIKPDIRLIGVSMDRGAAMAASITAGHPVEVKEVASLADSLGGGIGGQNQHTFPLCRRLLDEVVLVTEDDIYTAMQALYYEDRLVAEGACVVGIAALMAGKIVPSPQMGTVITGRNVDMAQFTRVVMGQDVRLGDVIVKGTPYDA
ncbi:hydroxyectoine utilization dehydratase EutB [Celeribacter baekdonensis]|uniref:Hydroxyectoine utilization dehydratase EutB n=1 Tax=Celeribacter baekdonensis TaxID=875171 RepID=A0A2R4M4Y3_9RHOB|nr:hydroxyectoine utilization dehydratase EutB [Celeribacter baekdonensis]AVW92112.1 hydroxyectoine utilization dehydratase EutB [Celeribacter baekdonensis]